MVLATLRKCVRGSVSCAEALVAEICCCCLLLFFFVVIALVSFACVIISSLFKIGSVIADIYLLFFLFFGCC